MSRSRGPVLVQIRQQRDDVPTVRIYGRYACGDQVRYLPDVRGAYMRVACHVSRRAADVRVAPLREELQPVA
ncbi:hypothetical protein F3K43_47350 [Streptomyces sp. LBUM 1476]|nr:hypothetical protein [Streptomyces sp. LBUM 1476]